MEEPRLWVPDPARTLYLQPDASNDGHGYGLFHKRDGRDPGFPEELAESGEPVKDFIKMGGRCWKPPMIHEPIFYREGYNTFWSLLECKFYIDCHPTETIVETDHAPLQWIKTNHSGKLSAWLVDKCAGMTFKIVHKPGKDMTVGDPLSRAPFVQRSTAHSGVETMITTLLAHIDRKAKAANVMWVWYDKDTTVAARMVQHWRTGSNPILCKAPKQENIISEWDYAIVAPASDRSTQVCGALLKTGKPFACLVPHDLLN